MNTHIRQCAWCRAVYDKVTEEWEPYETVIPVANHTICPECFELQKQEALNARRNNQISANARSASC